MTTPLNLDAIRARADAATEGPWRSYESSYGTGVEHGEPGDLQLFIDRAEADRDIWRDRWQQLMSDHERVTAERDRAEAALARVREALDDMSGEMSAGAYLTLYAALTEETK